MIDGFVIPANALDKFELRLDACNILEPILIREGDEKGGFFIDSDILNRDPRWSELLDALTTVSALQARGVRQKALANEELRGAPTPFDVSGLDAGKP